MKERPKLEIALTTLNGGFLVPLREEAEPLPLQLSPLDAPTLHLKAVFG